MPAGDLISASDYNNIRKKVSAVMGTGRDPSNPSLFLYDASHGYGQTVISSDVSTASTVTKNQWDQLRFDIYNALFHQTGTAPTITQVNSGDVITFGVSQPNSQYDTLATTARTNRYNLGTGQFGETTGVATVSRTGDWGVSSTVILTADFGSANTARYFFNSGGQIKIRASRTGGDSTSQNSNWSSFLTNVGTRAYGANNTALNYYSLTNSPQQFYTTTYGSTVYTNNRFSLDAYCDIANNSSGGARYVYIRVRLQDIYQDPDDTAPSGPGQRTPPNDIVNGTLTITADELKATGVLQPSPATGNFTVTSPTYSFGSITAS